MKSRLLRLRVASRLALAFALVLILTSAASAIGIWRLDRLQNIAENLGGVASQRALLARELHAIVVLSSYRAETLLQIDDRAMAERVNRDRKLTSARSEVVRKQLEALVDDARTRELFVRIDAAGGGFRKIRDALVARKAAGEAIGSDVVETTLRPAADAYAAAVDELAAYQATLVEEARVAAGRSEREGIAMLLFGMAAGLLSSLWCAWMLTRSIVRPLAMASLMAARVAAGDLRSTLAASDSRDEVQRLLADLHAMQDKLAGLVASVQSVSGSIATATGEIAAGNADLSNRTEQSAANLEETASSMEQLTATVRQSAESAQLANQLAASACVAASRGGAVVAGVVSTMDDIAKSSRRIADIIGVIDGIAFQTNILALNAAVESARAGEQGRGFAVVAGEVRGLAQRAALAAREIKDLIGESVGKIESGSRLVGEAGTAMGEIVASVKRVTDIVNEIGISTTQQSLGIGQVNEAVAQLDHMTQQNAALAEQSTAATQSLKEQAGTLSRAIGSFRLPA